MKKQTFKKISLSLITASIMSLSVSQSIAAPLPPSTNRLEGTYTAISTLSCVGAQGGFNASQQPITPSLSVAETVYQVGTLTFSNNGTQTYSGTFTNSILPASATNTTQVPTPGSGTFSTSSGTYSLSASGGITLGLGTTNISVLTGANAGVTLVEPTTSGSLSGQLSSSNNTIVLSTPTLILQTVEIYVGGVMVDSYPHLCNVNLTAVKM